MLRPFTYSLGEEGGLYVIKEYPLGPNNNNINTEKHLYNISYVSGTMLIILHILTHLRKPLWLAIYY